MTAFHAIQFGKYLLLDKIASGGMAELYRAKIIGDEGFEKIVAVKKILPYLAFDQMLVTCFIDEAKLAALLQHPNIVQIYDFGRMANSYFIAMELLSGKDLRLTTNKAKKANMPISLETALHITGQICEGLDYAHKLCDFGGKRLGIIHRDISPPNILITYSGHIKIIDFGIAKARNNSKDTQVGIIKGKVAYMSPEQADGKVIDHRSDIFATGILLYEMLARRRMFSGDDTLQVLAQVRECRFEPPEKVIGCERPELFGILNRALAKRPDDRYGTSGEMAAEIENLLQRLSERPSSQSISHYMHRLFQEEVFTEERAMQTAMLAHESAREVQAFSKIGTAAGGLDDAAMVTEVVGVEVDETAAGAPRALIGAEPGGVGLRRLKAAGLVFLLAAGIAFGSIFVFRKAVGNNVAGGGADRLSAAQSELKKKHFSAAARMFESVLSEHPDRKRAAMPGYIKALLGQASESAASDPRSAERLLLQAVGSDPENAEAFFQLGTFYTRQEQYPRAIAAYRKAAELNPEHPNIYYNLGYIYAKTKSFSDAEEMFKRTVALSPSFLDEALFNLAVVQRRLGKQELFIRNLKLALKANPDNRLVKEYLSRVDR